MKRLAVLALALLPALAVCEDEYTEEDAKTTTEMVNTFASCAGFYEFMAQFSESQQQPATAKHMRDYARGAESSATYLLTLESGAKGAPRKPNDFKDYVEAKKELNLTRLLALIEQKDNKAIEAESALCRGLLPAQEEIIQRIRNQISGR